MPRKIIFKHSRAIGDALMMTCGIRDFKLLFPDIDINVESNFPELWYGNPYINPDLKPDDEGVEFYKVGYPTINNCNNSAIHFTQSFLLDMIAIADNHQPLGMSIGEFTCAFANGVIGDPGLDKDGEKPFTTLREKYRDFNKNFGRQRPDIYMTEEEIDRNIIKESYGDYKYWVVAPGGKSDCTCKIWDWRRFQDVIDHFDGMLKFVVIGRSDHIVEKLDNVIDLTDKFNKDIRGLFSLVYNAEGCVSGVTFLMHLAAAMPPRRKRERKPCVAIYGGREPTSFTAYCNHQILHTNGAFTCCDNGGCWQSRVIPLPKKKSGNKRLCHKVIKDDGRSIQECMNSITAQDVIRAIDKYYDGDIYTYMKPPKKKKKSKKKKTVEVVGGKEINVLASLSSKGGGEQSACKIVELLRKAGWMVHFYPWETVNPIYDKRKYGIEEVSFKSGMKSLMKEGLPLLFYANDQINPFCREAQEVVDKSSNVIIGINYINGDLPKCAWLNKTEKLAGVIFQNEEKKSEFERDRIGFEYTKQIALYGAINLDSFLEVCTQSREKKDPCVILKHCMPDGRKWSSEDAVRGGAKIHLWQKNIIKETDVKFYGRLLKDTKNTKFEFMEAHKELAEAYKDEPRMVFHKFNAMPVEEFLSRGHIYLYRTSNAWRDNYPRVVAEALAAGLPVLSEPRDGTKDRMNFGNIGFHCIDYDGFLYAVKLLARKEKYRYQMGAEAKEWARKNLDPKKWVDVIEDLCNGVD